MDPVQWHLVLTILAVQLTAAWYDPHSTLPYFPIEISRTAASSPLATACIQVGFTSLLATCWLTQVLTWPRFVLWVGLMIVAFVPDTWSMGVHMAGVFLVVVAAGMQVMETGNVRAGLILLALFAVLFVLRIVVKLAALLAHREPETWALAAHIGFPKALLKRNQEIMLTGVSSERGALLPFFKLGGVLQWVCFYTLSFLF